MNIKQIANLEFYWKSLNKKISIEDYLKALLYNVWENGHSSNFPRHWKFNLYEVLIQNKIIKGVLNESNCFKSIFLTQEEEGNKIILQIIKQMRCQ